MLRVLYVSSTSACFELVNDEIFYSDSAYQVSLNGQEVVTNCHKNVFSLHGLAPNTDYRVSVGESKDACFRTRWESCCVNIVDFGAKGDGLTLDTCAIQSAINAVKPKGRIWFPEGVYYTAPLVLKSDITIEFHPNAKLLASADKADYTVMPATVTDCVTGNEYPLSSWEGEERSCYSSLLSAYHCSNIHIVGRGSIDGNGGSGDWYHNVKQQVIGRPRLCYFNNCSNVFMHGTQCGYSASWNIHPILCKNIGFYDISVTAEKDSPNTDGCNPEACDGVEIIGAEFSVGDDCIALKSGKREFARKYRESCRNITIRNCLMQYGHGAIVLGSEMAGGIKNLTVRQCVFRNTDRGLRIKTRRGRGKDGIIDGVAFERIRMYNVLTPLAMNMFYFCDPDGKTDYVQSKEPGKYPLGDDTPYLGSFTFKDLVCLDSEYAAGHFWGLPEQPIAQVVIEDSLFSMSKSARAGEAVMMTDAKLSSKEGLFFYNVSKVVLNNVKLSGVEGETVICHGVKEVEQNNVIVNQ